MTTQFKKSLVYDCSLDFVRDLMHQLNPSQKNMSNTYNAAYILTDTRNNKQYVGSSCRVFKRLQSHFLGNSSLSFTSPGLFDNNAWRYFSIVIITTATLPEAEALEEYYTELLDSVNLGYNEAIGKKRSVKVKEKLSAIARGNKKHRNGFTAVNIEGSVFEIPYRGIRQFCSAFNLKSADIRYRLRTASMHKDGWLFTYN